MKKLIIKHSKNSDGFTETRGDDQFLNEWLERQVKSNAFGKPGEYEVIGPTEIPEAEEKKKDCKKKLVGHNDELLHALAEKEEGNLKPMEAYLEKRKKIKEEYKE